MQWQMTKVRDIRYKDMRVICDSTVFSLGKKRTGEVGGQAHNNLLKEVLASKTKRLTLEF